MWRYLAGAGAALALAGAGVMIFSGHATQPRALPAAPAAVADGGGSGEAQELPDDVPAATAQTREQRRFGRYDKDRNGQVSRDEFLAARRKAFLKLDRNGDGQLSFDEWGTKAIARFAAADHDRSGAMNAAEFAATRVNRSARPRARARVNCPPTQARAAPAEPAEQDDS